MKKQTYKPHWTERVTLTFLLKHMIAGALGGFVFGGLLLYYDLSKLWTLISGSTDSVMILISLFFGLFITFGGLGIVWGIFSLAQKPDDPDDKTYY